VKETRRSSGFGCEEGRGGKREIMIKKKGKGNKGKAFGGT
jgi:hypothetical protein